jgi:hypothetical protein
MARSDYCSRPVETMYVENNTKRVARPPDCPAADAFIRPRYRNKRTSSAQCPIITRRLVNPMKTSRRSGPHRLSAAAAVGSSWCLILACFQPDGSISEKTSLR